MSRGRPRVLTAIMGCVMVVGMAGVSAGKGRPRAGWTRYVNGRWGFCVDYPARWNARPLPNGSGVTFDPDTRADPTRGTYISVSALPDQPDVDNANIVLDDSPPLDLAGNFARLLTNLREYDHASEIRVLEKRPRQFQGYAALDTKFVYQVGSSARRWAEETLWINDEYIIFTATLFGRPEQVRRLEPVYRDIVRHRFRLACTARQ